MSNVLGWMAQQPTLSPIVARREPPTPRGQRRQMNVLVRRLDGRAVAVGKARAQLAAAILSVLRQHGPQRLANVRGLVARGLYVSDEVNGQVGELLAAMRVMLADGRVARSDVKPYTWSAA